jgi:Tfp pilus assembly protein PilZ
MIERKEPRIKKNLIVSLSEDGFEGLGMTDNISRDGICVGVDKKIPVNAEIVLSLAVPGDILKIKGEVIWCRASPDNENNIDDEIGIRITDAPPEYQDFVEYFKRKAVPTNHL